MFGGVLLSHTLASAVPSALVGLASGFGMGPGVSRTAMAAETLWNNTIRHFHTCCVVGVWLFGSCTVDAVVFVVKSSAY